MYNKCKESYLNNQSSHIEILKHSIESISEQIKFLERRNKMFEDRLALFQIIELNNWKEFDASDYTDKGNNKYWMSFIGNQEEYDNFLESLEE